MSETAMDLGADEVHVWFLPVEPGSAGSSAKEDAVLSAAEELRRTRFVFEKDRRLYLASHILVRRVLSKYAEIPPADWSFAEGENGKPHITGPHGAPCFHFNLSHTEGLAAIAVTRDAEVGIDVELVHGIYDEQLARTCFTPTELKWIGEAGAARQLDRFFDLWTLKEAYLKARGTGLSTPLQELTVRPDAQTSAVIEFTSRIDDDSDSWQFERLRPTASHCLAVAVRRNGANRMSHRMLDARSA